MGDHLGHVEVPFDDPLDEVVGRVNGALEERQRWHLLLDAVVSMAADLSLDDLLDRIVAVAADLAWAKYAAISVTGDRTDHRLRSSVTLGMSTEEVARIGDLPEGRGVLARLIDRPEPLRLNDIVASDSYEFLAWHPPMRSFLGVPVRTRDDVIGTLHLTDKVDGSEFTEQDEEIVSALAAAAGVAIENARLHEEAARRQRWLSAAAEVTTLLARPGEEDSALQVVADRARDLASADAAWVVAGPDEAHLSLRVVSGMPATPEKMAEVDLDRSLARSVVVSGVSSTVEDLGSDSHAVNVATQLGWEPLGPMIMVPLRNAHGVEGVVALAWRRGTDPAVISMDPTPPTLFAEQAALALQIARSRRDEQRLALLEDRDRIARDLHDLVIQRLFAVGLGLQGLARLSDPGAVSDRIEHAVEDLDTTIRDIRRTIFALGAMDTVTDIRAAVAEVVERAARTLTFRPEVHIDGPLQSRITDELAPELLAVLTEALSNVARHARASACEVEISAAHGVLLCVTDDGGGMPAVVVESGLANMRHRAEQRGGHLTLTSDPGDGTTLAWWVPGS